MNSEKLVCHAIASDLSHDPIIKAYMRKFVAVEKVFVNTQPTLKGKKLLDIYHPNYLTKRLESMPIEEISSKSKLHNNIRLSYF